MEGKINLPVGRMDLDKLIKMFKKNDPVTVSFRQNGDEVSINIFFVSVGYYDELFDNLKVNIEIQTANAIDVKIPLNQQS